jgi:transposase
MKILQAYRYQLRPTESQRRNMARFAGCRRFVYNRALALQKERYAKGQRRLGFAELCKELTSWKRQDDTSFLRSAPAQVLQQISGAIRQVTVVEKNGKWFVNIQTELDVEKPMHPSNSMVVAFTIVVVLLYDRAVRQCRKSCYA